jgi:Flp pilus assembly protein TadD
MKRSSSLLVAALLAACAPLVLDAGDGGAGSSLQNPSASNAGAPAPLASVSPTGLLPRPGGPLEPARVQLDGPVSGHDLADVDGCARCHTEAAAQWRQSAHALASFNNPIYRVSVDRLRRDLGTQPSRFCAACHDVALLVDGAMDREIRPEDPRAHAGVSCRVCHGITDARPDGNGSYTLTAAPIPIPVEGDAASVKEHVRRATPSALKTREFCLSCHKTFLHPGTGNPSHLVGQDDATPWHRSAYAGSLAERLDEPIAERTCTDCHMPVQEAPLGDAAAKDGKLRSHRFLGGHTFLAALRRDQDQLKRAQEMLQSAATVDVAALIHEDGRRALPADGAQIRPGEAVTLAVVVRNTGAGHRFPGGVADAQDTWIELIVTDAQGRRVAEAGARHEREADDPTAHRLRVLQAGEDGKPLHLRETHLFRAPVYNHTVAPRDAAAVEYAFTAPSRGDAFPLKVAARLRHRSRSLELQDAACSDARSPRGRAFLEASRKITGTPLLPCAQQPVTDIAHTELWIGPGSEGRPGPDIPAWQRLYAHGLSMTHVLQERLDEARPSLQRALELAPGGAERARVLATLATVAARQGRVEETEQWLGQAAALAPGAPALARIRGEAMAQVWRWQDAVGPLREAAQQAPLDDGLQAQLALALGSAGQHAEALEVARRGLVLQPRDAELLRVQALALDALSGAPDETRAARDAYLTCRTPDEAPRVRGACSRDVPGCALERNPVHVHPMRQGP